MVWSSRSKGVPADLKDLMFFRIPKAWGPLRYRFVHGHVQISTPKAWEPQFLHFSLGTSSVYSATQRYRCVHGHVHILTPKAWESQFWHFFAWGPLVPTVLLSAIGVSMEMFIF